MLRAGARAWSRTTWAGCATVAWSRCVEAPPTGVTRTTAWIWLAAGSCWSSAGVSLHPGPGAGPAGAPRKRRLRTRPRAVPVHGQQRSLADRRGVMRGLSDGCRECRQRGQPSQERASERGAGDARAGHRPRRATIEAPERVRRRAFRLRHQPLRSGAGDLPRVSRRGRAHPLEHMLDPGLGGGTPKRRAIRRSSARRRRSRTARRLHAS